MNKARRKALEEINGKIEDLKSDLEGLRDEEQAYLDNMPESLQQGEKAEMAENAVGSMDEAIEALETAGSSVGDSAQ